MEEDKKNNKERNIIKVIIIIIVFLIILFLLVRDLGVIEVKAPTGNVDIFDITITGKDCDGNCCNCTGQCQPECNCSKCNKSSNCNTIQNGNTVMEGITIFDENVEYSNQTPLNIFSHKAYSVKNDVIAPGTENSYQFIIRNNNDFAIKYNLQMDEVNEYNINMKYRLKRDGKYVLGNDKKWITADELKQAEIVLANDTYNVYTLDWKWFESENDTEIGENIEANYELNIEFFADRY